METLCVAEQLEKVVENLEYQAESLKENREKLEISLEKITKGKSLISQGENLIREGKSLIENGEMEFQNLLKGFTHHEKTVKIIGHLNDQLKEVISLELSMADMDLDEDPPLSGNKPSLKFKDEEISNFSEKQLVSCTNLEKDEKLVLRPQRILSNPSSRIKAVEISPLEKHIFEKIKMIYELKQSEFCYPDHTGIYPRVNLLPGANPKLFKEIYEMGFLGTVYPSFNFDEIKFIPDLYKDLRQLKRGNVFLKFFQISPEYTRGHGVFEVYSLIEIGFVSETFNFEYEPNQPWKKLPNINKDFTKYRRALGFKTVSSIIKNFLKSHYVLKMKPEYSLIGRNGGIRDAEKELDRLADKMVNHEFIGSMETAQRLCKIMKHEDCTDVLTRLQEILDENLVNPNEEIDPFGISSGSPLIQNERPK